MQENFSTLVKTEVKYFSIESLPRPQALRRQRAHRLLRGAGRPRQRHHLRGGQRALRPPQEQELQEGMKTEEVA